MRFKTLRLRDARLTSIEMREERIVRVTLVASLRAKRVKVVDGDFVIEDRDDPPPRAADWHRLHPPSSDAYAASVCLPPVVTLPRWVVDHALSILDHSKSRRCDCAKPTSTAAKCWACQTRRALRDALNGKVVES